MDNTFWVIVPLTFTYHTAPTGEIIDTDLRTMDLPIMNSHLQEINTLVKQTHISHEQALENLIWAPILKSDFSVLSGF